MALPVDLLAANVTGLIEDGTTGDPIHLIVTIKPDFERVSDLPGGGSGPAILIGFPTLIIDTSIVHTGGPGLWEYTCPGDGTFDARILGWSEGVLPSRFTYTITVKRKAAPQADLMLPFSFNIQAGTSVSLAVLAPVKASAGLAATVINVGGAPGSGGPITADQITDASPIGVDLVTADGPDDARSKIGAGTSNLVLGSTPGTAKPGNAVTNWDDIPDKPATFTPGSHITEPGSINGITPTGTALLAAGSGDVVGKTIIGMSNQGLALSKASDKPTAQALLGLGNVTADVAAAAAAAMAAADAAAAAAQNAVDYDRLPAGTVTRLRKVNGVWSARPSTRTDLCFQWVGTNPSPPVVSSGTAGMYDGDDRGITLVD